MVQLNAKITYDDIEDLLEAELETPATLIIDNMKFDNKKQCVIIDFHRG